MFSQIRLRYFSCFTFYKNGWSYDGQATLGSRATKGKTLSNPYARNSCFAYSAIRLRVKAALCLLRRTRKALQTQSTFIRAYPPSLKLWRTSRPCTTKPCAKSYRQTTTGAAWQRADKEPTIDFNRNRSSRLYITHIF